MKSDLLGKLTAQCSELIPRLFPDGKKKGGEWTDFTFNGEPRSSFRINLTTGLWGHFATGQKGNMLSLLVYKNGGDTAAAIKEAHELLKLPPPVIQNSYKKPKIDWDKKFNVDSAPIQYLINERKIPASVLNEAQVRSNESEYIFVGYDESNTIAYVQYTSIHRNEDGTKKVRTSKKPHYKPVLFGMHSLPRKECCSYIIITEGVIDCLSFRASGLNAVSIPAGVSETGWIEHSWNFLSQFSTIFLCFDGDEAGQMGAERVASKLGIHRCKNVRLPGKDANEIWCSATDAERGADVSIFQKYLDEAKDFQPQTLVRASELRARVWQMIQDGPVAEKGDYFCGWKDMKVPFRIRPSELTIWTGYAGHGKSTLLLQHLAHQVFVLGKNVAIASLEISAEESLIKMITQAMGYFPHIAEKETFDEAYAIMGERVHIYNVKGKAKAEDLQEFFEFCIHRHNCEEIVLDSLMRTDLDIQGTDKSATYDKFMKFVDSSQSSGAHFHIVAHPSKGDDTKFDSIPTQYSVKGIGELVDNAFNVITVWRNKVKDASLEILERKNQPMQIAHTKTQYEDTRMIIQKNRNGQMLGSNDLWFDPTCYRWRTKPEHDYGKYFG